MADGYLEKRQRDYEARKAVMEREQRQAYSGYAKRKRLRVGLPQQCRMVERPEDEAL